MRIILEEKIICCETEEETGIKSMKGTKESIRLDNFV